MTQDLGQGSRWTAASWLGPSLWRTEISTGCSGVSSELRAEYSWRLPRCGSALLCLWRSWFKWKYVQSSPSCRQDLSCLQESRVEVRTLGLCRACRGQQSSVLFGGCSCGRGAELLYKAIKECFTSCCANCIGMERAAEGDHPSRPFCKVKD